MTRIMKLDEFGKLNEMVNIHPVTRKSLNDTRGMYNIQRFKKYSDGSAVMSENEKKFSDAYVEAYYRIDNEIVKEAENYARKTTADKYANKTTPFITMKERAHAPIYSFCGEYGDLWAILEWNNSLQYSISFSVCFKDEDLLTEAQVEKLHVIGMDLLGSKEAPNGAYKICTVKDKTAFKKFLYDTLYDGVKMYCADKEFFSILEDPKDYIGDDYITSDAEPYYNIFINWCGNGSKSGHFMPMDEKSKKDILECFKKAIERIYEKFDKEFSI